MRASRASTVALALWVVALSPVAGAASAARLAPGGVAASNPYPGYRSEVYADPAHWLCRPDKDDVCDHDLDATPVKNTGQTRVERFRAAAEPRIDCFYVYPTISTDPGGNSDFTPGDDQELFVVRQQAARLGEVCRVFAPVYRQITLTALIARLGGQPVPFDAALAYGDVADAWKHYVANDNQGRGVILIGHSQGAGMLTQLIQAEIDPNPELRRRLVSAMLLGGNLQVAEGRDAGGDFANVPLCRRAGQTGCAIAYSTFRADAPPPANSLFGGSRAAGEKAACVNPAALAGGSATLHPYLPTNGKSLPILAVPTPPAWIDPALGTTITTPFVTLPGFVDAACAERNGFVYLALTVHGDPADPRIDDIGGDLSPEWGLHLVDANVAMGDLVSVAATQARAWCAANGCPSLRRTIPLRLR